MKEQSLSHTVWECKYHIVWIPKYRKKSLYKDLRNADTPQANETIPVDEVMAGAMNNVYLVVLILLGLGRIFYRKA